MGQIEKSLPPSRVWKGYLKMAMGVPRRQEILAKSGPICQRPRQTSLRSIIAAPHALLLTPFSSFSQRGRQMGHIDKSLSGTIVRRGYTEMAMDGQRSREIQVESWRFRHSPKRPSNRPLIAAKDTLFLTPFLICYQGVYKMGQFEQSLSAIMVWKGTMKRRWILTPIVRFSRKLWRNHDQSVSAPEGHLLPP